MEEGGRRAADRRRAGGARRAANFLPALRASIARFNGFAAAGRDGNVGGGDRPIQLIINWPVKQEPGRSTPTL